MTDAYIKTASVARNHVGEKVYWDDVSARYIFLRSGILTGVFGRQVEVDGDYKPMKDMTNLRNFEMGGAWLRNKEAA